MGRRLLAGAVSVSQSGSVLTDVSVFGGGFSEYMSLDSLNSSGAG